MGRIVSGTLKTGQSVRVLGDKYTIDDREDMKIGEVT